MNERLLVAAAGSEASALLDPFAVPGLAAASGVRLLPLDDEPERALLKLIETVDLFLPREVLCFAMLPDEARAPLAPRSARNGDRAGGPLDPSGPDRIDVSIPPSRWSGALESEAPAHLLLNRVVYGLLRYAALRGGETWFQRRPPAGLDCLTGCLEFPRGSTPGSLRDLIGPPPK